MSEGKAYQWPDGNYRTTPPDYKALEVAQEIKLRDVPYSGDVFSQIREMVEGLTEQGFSVDVTVRDKESQFDFYAVRLPGAPPSPYNRNFNGVLPA